MSSQFSSALAVVLACSLAACGGGGGNSPTPTPSPTNRAPTLTASSAAVSVAENSTGTLFTLAASDPDGDNVSLTLSGADASFFTLGSGGAVSFKSAPNYDRFADADGDNSYVLVAQASDGRGGTVRSNVTVTVTNQREGIRVTRIASGFDQPVGMSLLISQTLLVAERGGRIQSVDGRNGSTRTFRTLTLPAGGAVMDIASETVGSQPLFPVALISDPTGVSLRFDISTDTPRDVRVATGAPDGASGRIAYSQRSSAEDNRFVLVAIGDPEGNRVGGASGYGNVSYVTPPYTGANSTITLIGRGVRQPGGWISGGGFALFADQGGSVSHELSDIDGTWPVNFGWPFLEGATRLMQGGPASPVAPSFAYGFGDGALEGSGIVGGALYQGVIASLRNRLVFGDVDGKIWSLPADFTASAFENRTADFTPDTGQIDEVVKIIVDDAGVLYILDADGELFRVDQA